MSTAMTHTILIHAPCQHIRQVQPYLHNLASRLGGQLETRENGVWVLAPCNGTQADEALGELFDSGLVRCLSF